MKYFLGFILSIYILLPVEGRGIHIHVSPSGNDSNPGTESQPVASLAGARNVIRAMRAQKTITDTVYVQLQSGDYFMDETFVLTPADGGAAKSPVIYRGQKDGSAILYGGKETDRFEVVVPGLWRVLIPEAARYGFTFEQLYINGERRFRAQTPNRGSFNMVKRVDETVVDAAGERRSDFAVQKVVLHDADAAFIDDINPEEINDALVVFYHSWDNTVKRIQHLNRKDTALYITGQAMKPWNKINSNSRYIIENYRKALDAPGEWFLQRDGYLYYIPLPGETPEKLRCMYPVIDYFVRVEGSRKQPIEHIRFENLSFRVSGYRTPAEGSEPQQAAYGKEASVMLDCARNMDFINCSLAHTGLHGIWYRKGCSDSKIDHCHLYDLGGGAVKIGDTTIPLLRADTPDTIDLTRRITVNNNILHHGGYVLPCGVGVIIFNACDNRVTHNEIADFRYSGVSVGWVWGYSYSPSKRNKIEFNHIHHLGWGELCDMGGVYTLGASEGTTVSNNVIHHIYSYRYGGWGLYTDEGSYQVLMENNLVYACKDAGFHQHYGKENVIRNNIFALNLRSQLQFSKSESHQSFSLTNNIVYYSEGELCSSRGWEKANIIIDSNCYWNTRSKSIDFYKGLSLEVWRWLNRDRKSIVEDPLFVDAARYDFRFRKTTVAKKIDFKPFDFTKAGVYGSDDWIKKAKLGAALEEEFDKVVRYFESLQKQ